MAQSESDPLTLPQKCVDFDQLILLVVRIVENIGPLQILTVDDHPANHMVLRKQLTLLDPLKSAPNQIRRKRYSKI